MHKYMNNNGSNQKVFIDHLGITNNMSPKELFEFLKRIGRIDKNAKFEDWKIKKNAVNVVNGEIEVAEEMKA